PRRVEMAIGNQTFDKVAAGIEDIYETVAGTGYVISPGGVLFRVGHKNLAVDVTDPERRKTGRQIRVHEAVGIHLLKGLVVTFHPTGIKVGHEKKIVTTGNAQRRAFINGARTVVPNSNSLRAIQRGIPSRHHAVLIDETKPAWLGLSALGDFEKR